MDTTNIEARLAKPELLTRAEFYSLRIALYKANGLGGHSPRRQTIASLAHGEAVRAAVRERRDIHVDNWCEVRAEYPTLKRYSINGNLAVYDRTK